MNANVKIEFWSDSFHEGFWACQNLAKVHELKGGTVWVEFIHGFIPKFIFSFPKGNSLEITVFGSYNSWTPVPKKVSALLDWGKPDLVAYRVDTDEILFAVEETAAIPTGNQALQRCERLFGSSHLRIPFWYLLAEFGRHKDGGIRRDSIWPSIMALKLSLHYRTPCAILHYSTLENPESYDFGTGVQSLFEALYKMLSNSKDGLPHTHNLDENLVAHYKNMIAFIKSQYRKILDYLPGHEHFDNVDLPILLAKIAIGKDNLDVLEFAKRFPNFLVWSDVKSHLKSLGKEMKSSSLLKHDGFCELLEKSIDQKKTYIISQNAGSKPQNEESMTEWIKHQQLLFDKQKSLLKMPAPFKLRLSDFPKSEAGNYHITTAKNILYLFDRFEDLKVLIYQAFPRLVGHLDLQDQQTPCMVYISNSIKPGRIFGDPFTGQISAYATSFGKFDPCKRLVIAYYPHQSFTQVLAKKGKQADNKGLTMMRELVDFAIFGGGVVVRFPPSGEIAIL